METPVALRPLAGTTLFGVGGGRRGVGFRPRWYPAAAVALALAVFAAELPVLTVLVGPPREPPRRATGLPALESTPAPVNRAPTASGDFAHPPPPADASVASVPRTGPVPPFDLARARLVERTASSEVYANPDGTRTARIHAGPVNWQDPSGAWRPIDPRLVPDGEGGLATASGPLAVSFAPDAARPGVVRYAAAGWSVELSLAGAAPTPVERTGDAAVRYAGVAPGVDLEYRTTAHGRERRRAPPLRPRRGGLRAPGRLGPGDRPSEGPSLGRLAAAPAGVGSVRAPCGRIPGVRLRARPGPGQGGTDTPREAAMRGPDLTHDGGGDPDAFVAKVADRPCTRRPWRPPTWR